MACYWVNFIFYVKEKCLGMSDISAVSLVTVVSGLQQRLEAVVRQNVDFIVRQHYLLYEVLYYFKFFFTNKFTLY